MTFALTPSDGNGNRFADFKLVCMRFYEWKWGHGCPWDGSDANQLSRLLKASPELDLLTFRRWLLNYGESEDISPGERPRKFLPRIHDYSVVPLDRYRRDRNAKSGETFAERDAAGTSAAL